MKLTPIKGCKAEKYWIIAISACMVCICLGFCSSNASLYLSAITEALNIPRSLYSIKDSCRFISTSIVNLFFGALIAKFGAKKLIAAGFACLIGATLIFANASQVYAFYIGGCLLGIGFAWTTTTMVSYLVNRWFTKNRGTINGLVLCANGLGGAAAAQIVTPIIYEEGNLFGYRNAYQLVAILLLIVGVLAVLIIREPDGSRQTEKKKARGDSWTGITLNEALRKPYFYVAALGVFLTGVCLQGITSVGGAHLRDIGIDPGFVATVLSVHSVILCGSKFIAGISYDKLGLRVTLLLCQGAALLSFMALGVAGTDTFGMICAVAWGALSSLALPLETVMLPLITADLFGERDFPKLVGIIVSLNTAGYAVGTPLVNLIYDMTGSYIPMLYIVAPLIVVLMILFAAVIHSAEKLRKRVCALEEEA